MADSALTLIQSAYEQIKIYAPGVPINAADSARALAELNTMLDEWSNEKLTCYANLEQSLLLIPGQQSYTAGSGGYLPVRPLTINTGRGAAYLMDSNQNRYPVNVVEQDEWNMIGLLNETSNLPDTLFYDPQYPLGIVNIFPLPLQAFTVYFDSRLQIADMPTLATLFSLPPGYSSAIRNNLACRLWGFFKQGDPTPWLAQMAMRSLAAIKRTNIRQSPSTYDSAIVSRAKSSYNIYTDSYNRAS
jgi:hypothetical protein